MMIGMLLAMSLFGNHAPGVEHKVVTAGNWRVKITRDAFASTTTCTVRAGDMLLQNAGVVFELGAERDTYRAVYRIDGGAPRNGRIGMMTAAQLGVDLGLGARLPSLSNPSGGLVAVPVAELAGAHQIELQAGRGQRPRRFDVSHLGEAISAARSAGCPLRTAS